MKFSSSTRLDNDVRGVEQAGSGGGVSRPCSDITVVVVVDVEFDVAAAGFPVSMAASLSSWTRMRAALLSIISCFVFVCFYRSGVTMCVHCTRATVPVEPVCAYQRE